MPDPIDGTKRTHDAGGGDRPGETPSVGEERLMRTIARQLGVETARDRLTATRRDARIDDVDLSRGSLLERLLEIDPHHALELIGHLEVPGYRRESFGDDVRGLIDGTVRSGAARELRRLALESGEPYLMLHALKGELERAPRAGIEAARRLFEDPAYRPLVGKALGMACAARPALLPALARLAPGLYAAACEAHDSKDYAWTGGRPLLGRLVAAASPSFVAAHLARTDRKFESAWTLAANMPQHLHEGQLQARSSPAGVEIGVLRYFAEHPSRIDARTMRHMCRGVLTRLRHYDREDVPFETARFLQHFLAAPERINWSYRGEGDLLGIRAPGGRFKSPNEILDEFTLSRRDVAPLVDALREARLPGALGQLRSGAFSGISPAALRSISEWVGTGGVSRMTFTEARENLLRHLSSQGHDAAVRREIYEKDRILPERLELLCWVLTQRTKSFEDAHSASIEVYGAFPTLHWSGPHRDVTAVVGNVLANRNDPIDTVRDAVVRSAFGRGIPPPWLRLATEDHALYGRLFRDDSRAVATALGSGLLAGMLDVIDRCADTTDPVQDPMTLAWRRPGELRDMYTETTSKILLHLARVDPLPAQALLEVALQNENYALELHSRGDRSHLVEIAYASVLRPDRAVGWLRRSYGEEYEGAPRIYSSELTEGRLGFMVGFAEPADPALRDAFRYVQRALTGAGPTPMFVNVDNTRRIGASLEERLAEGGLDPGSERVGRMLLDAVAPIHACQERTLSEEQLMSIMESRGVLRTLDAADESPRGLSNGLGDMLARAEAHANVRGQTVVSDDPSLAWGIDALLPHWQRTVERFLGPNHESSFGSEAVSIEETLQTHLAAARDNEEIPLDSASVHLPGAPKLVPARHRLGTLSRPLQGRAEYLVRDLCVEMDGSYFAHHRASGGKMQEFLEAVQNERRDSPTEPVRVTLHGIEPRTKLAIPHGAELVPGSVTSTIEPSVLVVDDDNGLSIWGAPSSIGKELDGVSATFDVPLREPRPGSQSIRRVHGVLSNVAERADPGGESRDVDASDPHEVVTALTRPFTKRENLPADLLALIEEAELLPAAEAVELVRDFVHTKFRYELDLCDRNEFKEFLEKLPRTPPAHDGSNEYLELIYEMRAGVCGQLATVMVDLLRHAGVPAMWTSGYVPSGVEITEFDSHAWATVVLLDENDRPFLMPVEATSASSDVAEEYARRTARRDAIEESEAGEVDSAVLEWVEARDGAEAMRKYEEWRSGLSTVGVDARVTVAPSQKIDPLTWERVQAEFGVAGLDWEDGLRLQQLGRAASAVMNSSEPLSLSEAMKLADCSDEWWHLESVTIYLANPRAREALLGGLGELGYASVDEVPGLRVVLEQAEQRWQVWLRRLEDLGPDFWAEAEATWLKPKD